jgi:hypothetical protein
MSIEVHLDWEGSAHFVGVLHPAERLNGFAGPARQVTPPTFTLQSKP